MFCFFLSFLSVYLREKPALETSVAFNKLEHCVCCHRGRCNIFSFYFKFQRHRREAAAKKKKKQKRQTERESLAVAEKQDNKGQCACQEQVCIKPY